MTTTGFNTRVVVPRQHRESRLPATEPPHGNLLSHCDICTVAAFLGDCELVSFHRTAKELSVVLDHILDGRRGHRGVSSCPSRVRQV